MDSLAALFPEEDFRHHLTLRRGDAKEFFRSKDVTGSELAERSRWIAADPGRYVDCLPEGDELVAEFSQLCADWRLTDCESPESGVVALSAQARLRKLGTAMEADILFLSSDPEGSFRLRGGVLCFPTGWALTEKLGQTLDFIHGVVPGLNSAIGPAINQFLSKLRPGAAVLRNNWGIVASSERNQHPVRGIPPPALPLALDRLWLRVENQALVALPRSRGVVFGIRIEHYRLDEILPAQTVRTGLLRSLSTMPQAMAVYKRIDDVRDALLREIRLIPQ